MIYSTTPKRRLSLQIIRVARELEALHVLGEASATTIELAIGKMPPRPVCLRTIQRDLEALEVAGLVAHRETLVVTATFRQKMKVWRLAEPFELRQRLNLLKGLSPKQIQLLKEGKPIA